MATVTKEIADDIIAGKYEEDAWARIVKYTNAWGGESYGAETARELGKYAPSQYVINPETYWERAE